MKIEILISVLVLFIFFAGLCFIVSWGNRRTDRGKRLRTDVLSMLLSCNTYLPLLDVFTRLDEGLKKYNIDVQDNFGGYFKDE